MTLVSIVGDFPSSVLPLFYELHPKLKHHIIVYDDFRMDILKAQQIIKGTKKFVEINNLPIQTHTLQIDEDNTQSLQKIVNNIFNVCDNPYNIFVNATDGLANIALFLANKTLSKGVSFLTYDRYDNTYNLFNDKGMQTHTIEKNMRIREHFLLKNISIDTFSDLSLAHKYEADLIEIFEGYNGDVEEYLRVNHKHCDYLCTTPVGFLYEFYIYNLLKGLAHDDIAVGVKVRERYSNASEMLNEFDILIQKDNHLHMIECKYKKTLGYVDLVYKMDSVRSTLDDESKIMIVTNKSVYDEQKDRDDFIPTAPFKRANAKKIYMRGSPIKDIERFIREVDAVFNLQTPDIKSVIQNRPKLKTSYVFESIDAFHTTLTLFANNTLALKEEIFDAKVIKKVLNYKMNYRHNQTLTTAMQNPKIKELFLQLNRVKNFQNLTELRPVFLFFINNLQEKNKTN